MEKELPKTKTEDQNIKVLRGYEQKIIDLTRRNRLLKYPSNGRAITFPLTLSEFQTQFGNVNDLTIQFSHSAILAETQSDDAESVNVEEIYVPPTNPKGEKLISVLQALRLDTKRKLEEHGLHTLFLTIGRIRWKEPQVGRGSTDATEGYDYDAPLILVPIEIKDAKNPRKSTVIKTYLDAGDIIINPTLILLLESSYGVQNSGLPIVEETTDLIVFFRELTESFTKTLKDTKIKFEINDTISIGQYSFYGQQIYEDLKHNEEKISKHEFINALCGNGQLTQKELSVDSSPDDLLAVEEDFCVMDADVSQLQVIQKALQGNSLVVQGPPGTGKSQTIVNLISNLLARGKKVLVVCEKQVALEVVLKRLRSVGLDKLCLPLFNHKTDKGAFARSIIDDRDFIIRNFDNTNKDIDLSLQLRGRSMERLRDYATSLAAIVDPLGRSVHWVHGELARAQGLNTDAPLPWLGSDPLEITIESYQNILSLLNNVSPILKQKSNPMFEPWNIVQKELFSPDYAARITTALEAVRDILDDLKKEWPQSIVVESTQDFKNGLDSIENLARLNIEPIVGELKQSVSLKSAFEFIKYLVDIVTKYQNLNSTFTKTYKVPLEWKSISLPFGVIKEETTLIDVTVALKDASKVQESINLMMETAELLNNPGLLDLSLSEAFHYRNILLINPLVKRIKDWSVAESLAAAVNALTALNTIYYKLDEANKTFERWAILLDDLAEEDIQLVAKEFNKKYYFITRFFTSDYKKAKDIIIRWCNVNTPGKFKDFKQVVDAVNNHGGLKQKLNELLIQFSKNYIETDKSLVVSAIPILYSNSKNVVEWMRSEGKEEIPEHLKEVIEKNNDSVLVKKFGDALNDLYSILDGSWRIFSSVSDLSRVSLKDFLGQFKNLYDSADTVALAENEVVKIVSKVDKPLSLNELRSDCENIESLSKLLEKIDPVELSGFMPNLKPEDIVENERFSKVVESIYDLSVNLDKLLGGRLNLSVEEAIKIVKESSLKSEIWKNIVEKYDIAVTAVNKLLENSNGLIHIEQLPVDQYYQQLLYLLNDQQGLEVWMEYRKYSHQVKDAGHLWFLEQIEGKVIENPAALFAQSLWNAWLEGHYQHDSALQNFNLREHQKIMQAFKTQERKILTINAERTLRQIAPAVKKIKQIGGSSERFLIKQSQLTKRHKPVRQVVTECNYYIQEYKPCWMMSPLTLGSYIPYGTLDFDVVIFDEASQMRVEHALGSIARGKQIIVFGDEHQLPPTSFFDASSDSEEELEDQDFESILHASRTVLPGSDDSLLYHYRSKYEDLIAFSNHEVYGDRLITFPNPNHNIKGVEFEYVEDGVFLGSSKKDNITGTRRNDIEAQRVVEICAKCAAEHPNKSIGVIAFSRSQEIAIRDALIDFLKINPEFSTKLDENQDGPDAFFIKNLESVQGDEREIIVLSVGYGRDRNGNFLNRFGPINGKNGYRRLNVAITRAQEKIICVSSMKSTDMNPGEASRGAKMLQKYLEYVEFGPKSLDAGRLVNDGEEPDADSPFEIEVQRALEQIGYKIHRQVGASGFKIDLAIVNPKTERDFILGIECDGASYHSSYSARVNDRLRQDILEGLGWKIYRVWSQHWVAHREEVLEDIVRSVSSQV